MKSDWTIQCPHCKKVVDFAENPDNWEDWMVDDSCYHFPRCPKCNEQIPLQVNANYWISSVPEDEL